MNASLRLMVLLLATSALLVGCEPEPTTYNVPSLLAVHHLLVAPMRSSDPGVGPVASGAAFVHLANAALPQLTVAETPILWRLSGASPATPQDLAAAGQQFGADAVLTGVSQCVPPSTEKGDSQVAVTVQIVSTETGDIIYEHTGQSTDKHLPTAFTQASQAALKPFEALVRQNRKP